MSEDDPAVGLRDAAHDVVQITMVFPQVPGAGDPELLSAPLDGLRLMPKVLPSKVKPVLGSFRIRPMIVVSEYRLNAEWSFEPSMLPDTSKT